jgi:hypothetical protein
MLERPCTSLKTLHATCYTRARQSRLNGSADPSAHDGVMTRPHWFNAATAPRTFLDDLSNSGNGELGQPKTDTGEVVTQYLAAILTHRELRRRRLIGRSDGSRKRRAQRRDEGCWCQGFCWRPATGKQREVAAVAAHRKGAHHRLAIAETKEHISGFWVVGAADLDALGLGVHCLSRILITRLTAISFTT